MPSVQDLLNAIGMYHRSVQKALCAKRDRGSWVARTEAQATSVRSLLSDATVTAELDKLLAVLQTELEDREIAMRAANILKKHLADFVKAEANLHQLTHVRSKLYLEVVDEVQPWISSKAQPHFPHTAEEFRRVFERVHESFQTTIRESVNLSRKQSKRAKGEFLWQFWRYSLGTLITVANVYMSYHQPAFQGMGGTSVTVGAWYFVRSQGGPRKPPKTGANPSEATEQSKYK